jgi:hypothetical protein
MLKSNNFCEASQVKHCQKSKPLPSPKQGCNLLICYLKALAKIMALTAQVLQS